ncbi:MAG: beta-Ala-His dipeptidase [Lachnospiraceae bacterium]|nr:beta-Ala-His dipeptidase [Lachnospiraceae bacterium]
MKKNDNRSESDFVVHQLKKLLVVFTLILCCVVTGCANNVTGAAADAAENVTVEEDITETDATVVTETDITEDILAQFEEFTQIPRPSHHEEQISNYLFQWAKDHGFEVTQDEENNIIFDVPATEGMEGAPITALQAHMDMVFAVKEGLELDPLTTKIVSKLDGNILSSDGNTSLGADDGIGLAIILQICEGKMSHGPLRIFVTTNEENGMTGAPAIKQEMLDEVAYMINIDSEEEGKVTVSSVAGTNYIYEETYEMTKPTAGNALLVEIKGLTGGHSGLDIDKQRGNANKLLSSALSAIFKKGIDPEIASFDGGTANNAIASSAKTVICLNEKEKTEKLLEEIFLDYKEALKDTDPDMTFSVTDTQMPEKALSVNDSKDFTMLFSEIPDGVYTWSEEIENFPESSSNLGILKLEDGKLHSESYARSSSPEKKEKLEVIYRENAEKYGNVEVILHKHSEAWAYNPDSRLLEITKEAYKDLFGKDIEVLAIHAGLECGTFAAIKPGIALISIGPTIYNPHTINEVCLTDTIEPVWKLIESILTKLG